MFETQNQLIERLLVRYNLTDTPTNRAKLQKVLDTNFPPDIQVPAYSLEGAEQAFWKVGRQIGAAQHRQCWTDAYKRYLQSEDWAERSAKVRARDKVCCFCGSDKDTEVAHRDYKLGWDAPLEKLFLLCCECHDVFDGRLSRRFK